MNKKLILEDGSVFEGYGFGSDKDKKVELVFNTSMVGYQEILSDPSYTYQAVVMTYPLIGNYGMCEDDYESDSPSLGGFVVREYSPEPSNFRCTKTLSEVMEKYDIAGIAGVDTRKIARHIREKGTMKAMIASADTDVKEAVYELKEWSVPTDAVSKVSTKEIYDFALADEMLLRKDRYREIPKEKYKVVAIDCGMKKNILREMTKKGCRVTVVPWDTTAEEILKLSPDGIFISNGPGDPQDADKTVETIKNLIGKRPIFGICLGHQIISLAYGAKTYKLKFGHRGGNHPVLNRVAGKIEITSQNHSYAVDAKSLQGTELMATHINILDKTIEGLKCGKDKVFSVQYHPESAPGPQDSGVLFDQFIGLMKEWREENA